MMTSSFIKTSAKRAKMLREWRKWVMELCKVVEEVLPEAEVYVIGSVARGDFVASSDVDVVVVSQGAPEKLSERAGIRASIEEKLNLPYYHPFEIHLVRPDEAEPFFRRAGKYIIRLS